jgi:hypothetical protein
MLTCGWWLYYCCLRTALKTIPAYWLPGSIPVPLYGRQDSLKSLMSDADLLPKSSNTPTELVNQFALKGFSKEEMTVLTGEPAAAPGTSHTSCVSSCARL